MSLRVWKIKNFLLTHYFSVLKTPSPGFPVQVFLHFLTLLSYLYKLIIQGWVLLYQTHFLKSQKLPCKVLSVGNITLGGTGKTPLVEVLVHIFSALGKKTAVLSRGYGRQSKGISLGNPKTSFQEIGDEPAMLVRKLKNTPVFVGPDRFEVGREALKNFQLDVLILDDGFQHLRLKRDLDIVLIDATHPFGEGHLIPRGFLREPVENLNRADLFLITRSDEVNSIEEIGHTLRTLNPRAPIWTCRYEPSTLRKFQDSLEIKLPSLTAQKILAFSGIGNPSSFLNSLRKAGLSPIRFLEFPDHYPYSLEELKRIEDLALTLQVDYVITTEKDEVRMEGFKPQTDLFHVLGIRLEIDGRDTFQQFLIHWLNR
jgi:tetraacyldisaccharide 4'-kinase